MAKINHTDCTHPRTPAGRRACRAAVANGTTLDMTPDRSVEMDRQVAAFSRAFDNAKAEIKMTGPVARRMARHAAKADRIQPRKSGARVSTGTSTCVQAALHTSGKGCVPVATFRTVSFGPREVGMPGAIDTPRAVA